MNGAQMSLFDLGPARRPAADFWTREDEDRDDYRSADADDTNEET